MSEAALEASLPAPAQTTLLSPAEQTVIPEQLPPDPDNEATVHDFLDYTEWLASDIIRSLRLIRDQDQLHHKCVFDLERLAVRYAEGRPNSSAVNDAAAEKKYGCLGADSDLAYMRLRLAISRKLNEAIKAREEAKAEADRLYDNVDRHFNRLSSVLYKLQQTPLPDREPTPKPGPEIQDEDAHMKITLRVDRSSGRRGFSSGPLRGRRSGSLAFSRLGRGMDGQEDPWEDLPNASPLRTPKRRGPGRRPNVGFQPKPLPPPPTTETGEPIDPMDLPWNRLLPHELARLRKRMKKNTHWTPSTTMILRELESLGRGVVNKQKYSHQLNNERYPHCPPEDGGIGSLGLEGGLSAENRGLKLNVPKRKLKAARAAAAAAAAAIATTAADQQAIEIAGPGEASVEEAVVVKKPITIHLKAPTTAVTTESPGNTERSSPIQTETDMEDSKTCRGLKSTGPDTDRRLRAPSSGKATTPMVPEETSTPVTRQGSATVPSPVAIPTTPIPTGQKRKRSPSSPVWLSATENGKSAEMTEVPKETTPVAPVPLPPHTIGRKRGSISAASAASAPATSTVVPVASTEESTTMSGPVRRGRPPGKRKGLGTGGKSIKGIKEGALGAEEGLEGGSSGKEKEESTSDIYEEEEMEVNPHEPRYCVCNAHSYGTMVACDSKECPTEWFHLQCVGLTNPPAKNTKWFCPNCREDKEKSKNINGNSRRRNSSVVNHVRTTIPPTESAGAIRGNPSMEEDEDALEEVIDGTGRKKRRRKVK